MTPHDKISNVMERAMEPRRLILVVEDEIDILSILQAILEGEGYEVIACSNGLDAWEYLTKEKPDLVLTDLMMPYLTGMDLIQRMRKNDNTKDIPVIVMSCLRPNDAEAWNGFIGKPFAVEDMLSVVNNTFALHPMSQQSG